MSRRSARGAERIAVALDTGDWEEFRSWADLFGGRVGYLKVGLEAYVRWGPRAVETALAAGSRVFLDLKLHDIPNTVAGAVASVRSLGVHLVTVHAGGGRPQLEAATAAAGKDLGILAVTVLTSLGDAELAELDLPGTARARVERWGRLAVECGCAGLVASALEARALRQLVGEDTLLVTPGIRPAGAEVGDQRRVATPAGAVADGADLLVIGRPLTRAADPAAAVDAVVAELEAAGG